MNTTASVFPLRIPPARSLRLDFILIVFWTFSFAFILAFDGRFDYVAAALIAGWGLSLFWKVRQPRATLRTWWLIWGLPIAAVLLLGIVMADWPSWWRLGLLVLALLYIAMAVQPSEVELGQAALTFRTITRRRVPYSELVRVELGAAEPRSGLVPVRMFRRQPWRPLRVGPVRRDETIWLTSADARLFLEGVPASLHRIDSG